MELLCWEPPLSPFLPRTAAHSALVIYYPNLSFDIDRFYLYVILTCLLSWAKTSPEWGCLLCAPCGTHRSVCGKDR